MSTTQVGVERRASQRFEFQLPVRIQAAGCAGNGFSQGLSGRGVSFITDLTLVQGEAVELTLMMPSEITLGESMKVRCRGQVKRVQALDVAGKSLVAVHFAEYAYLPEETAPKVTYAPPVGSEGDQAGASVHTFDWRGLGSPIHR